MNLRKKSFAFWIVVSAILGVVAMIALWFFGKHYPIPPTYLPTDDMVVRRDEKYVWEGSYQGDCV